MFEKDAEKKIMDILKPLEKRLSMSENISGSGLLAGGAMFFLCVIEFKMPVFWAFICALAVCAIIIIILGPAIDYYLVKQALNTYDATFPPISMERSKADLILLSLKEPKQAAEALQHQIKPAEEVGSQAEWPAEEIVQEYYLGNYGDLTNRLILTQKSFMVVRKHHPPKSYSLSNISSVIFAVVQPNKLYYLVGIVGIIAGIAACSMGPAGIIVLIAGVVTYAKSLGKIELQIWFPIDDFCKYENRYVLMRRYDSVVQIAVDDKLVQFIQTVNTAIYSKAIDIDPAEEYLAYKEEKPRKE